MRLRMRMLCSRLVMRDAEIATYTDWMPRIRHGFTAINYERDWPQVATE